MKFKALAKLGTFLSILLFCLALVYYAFMQLGAAERHHNVNLFSLVPADCDGVVEADDIGLFLDDALMPNYSGEMSNTRFSELFDFILYGLKGYASENVHGLGHHMGHFLVSFHRIHSSQEQVIYFRMNASDRQMLKDMLLEYAPGNFLPKEEMYRGKRIQIFPLGDSGFLVSYEDDGFLALSYQKSLIEKVIDAGLDKMSLEDDEVFSKILETKKKRKFLTLYARNAFIPSAGQDSGCWNEYEFHVNSDVLYLTGETYVSDRAAFVAAVGERLKAVPLVDEERLIVSADRDSTVGYINRASDANENGVRTLFNECVSNLSYESSFTFVADMALVADTPQRFQGYLPSFILDNASLFSHFILSVQLMVNGERPSHIWVFTYKN